MMSRNQTFRKCLDGCKLSVSQENIDHQMYMDDKKKFIKKKLKSQIQTIKIYPLDGIGHRKCAMLIMRMSRKITKGIEVPNTEKNRTLGKKTMFNYLGILGAGTIKKVVMEKKLKRVSEAKEKTTQNQNLRRRQTIFINKRRNVNY